MSNMVVGLGMMAGIAALIGIMFFKGSKANPQPRADGSGDGGAGGWPTGDYGHADGGGDGGGD